MAVQSHLHHLHQKHLWLAQGTCALAIFMGEALAWKEIKFRVGWNCTIWQCLNENPKTFSRLQGLTVLQLCLWSKVKAVHHCWTVSPVPGCWDLLSPPIVPSPECRNSNCTLSKNWEFPEFRMTSMTSRLRLFSDLFSDQKFAPLSPSKFEITRCPTPTGKLFEAILCKGVIP